MTDWLLQNGRGVGVLLGVFLLGGIFFLSACSSFDVLNLTVPRGGYALHRDIAYGTDARQKLDIYMPEAAVKPPATILFFYGGSWQGGSKDDYRFVGQALASKGFIAVVADYRVYPQAYFPAFVEDGASAFVWAHKHIGEYGGDATQLYLAGHSAGGYIAAMLAVNERYVTAVGGQMAWIKGVIGLAGPYDFLPFTDRNIIALFSTAKDVDTQPITFVHAGTAPMLLLTGDEDNKVSPKNSIHLAAKLKEYGNAATQKTYKGIGHVGILLSLANGFRGHAPVLEDIETFVRERQSSSQ